MLRDDWFNLHKNDASGDAPDAKKKWNNWWYYNKWFVIIGLIAAVLVFDFARSIYVNRTNRPDVQIAYLGSPVPDSALDRLEEALTPMAPDANGDGQVIVSVTQYNLYSLPGGPDPTADPATFMAAQTKLAVDLQTGDSMIFLMPDPELFRKDSQALCRIDGTLPEQEPDSGVPLYLAWKDCPVLAGLDLGSVESPVLEDSVEMQNQSFFESMSIGRRWLSGEDDPEAAAMLNEFWNALIAGASAE